MRPRPAQPGSDPAADVAAVDFSTAASTVARSLRLATAQLLDELPGTSRTGTEVARTLNIDINLAWKLLVLARPAATDEDATEALRRVPGPGGIRILLQAAASKGVSDSTISRLSQAFTDYQRLVEKHAGDRASLDSLLIHASGTASGEDLAIRRAAYRANSSIVGVQAETQLAAYLFWPERDAQGQPSSAAAILRGLVGFSRLRADVSWIIGKGRRTDERGQAYGQPRLTPVDPETAAECGGVPLVRLLSRGEIPPVERSYLPDGTSVDRILGGPVGKGSRFTYFLAETIRPGLAQPGDPNHPVLKLATSSHTPTGLQIVDVLFHRDLPPMGAIRAGLASELGGISAAFTPDDQRLTIHGAHQFESHGSDISGMTVPGLPKYGQALADLCTRLGVELSDFQAYRIKVAFPPIPCAILFERDMSPA